MPVRRPTFRCPHCRVLLRHPVYPRLPKPTSRILCPECKGAVPLPPWPEDGTELLEDVDDTDFDVSQPPK